MMKNDIYFPVSFINEIKHSLSKKKKKRNTKIVAWQIIQK